MSACLHCAAREAALARAEERIAQLEAALRGDRPMPLEFCLTGQEARVLGVILAREVATKDAVMAALYRDEGREEAGIKIVDIFVCKIRRKLKPFGLAIATRWGAGYAMSAAHKASLRAMMDRDGPAQAEAA